MKRNGLIIAAWLLLLIPTLLIGVGALRLLKHEQQRIAGTAVAAASDRARSVTESIELAVTEVKEGLLATLNSFPPQGIDDRLDRWRLGNPLIRNVFVWSSDGLAFPAPGGPLSEEEAAFIGRYQPLFSGQKAWSPPVPDRGRPFRVSAAEEQYSARLELRELTQAKAAAPASISAASLADASGPGAQGWIPWFSENRLYLLGWVQPAGGELRYGVEIETMALLARLVATLPPESPSGEVYALLDGNGEIFHQSGAALISPGTPEVAALQVGPALPHWQVAVYDPSGTLAGAGDGGFYIISTLVVGAFVAAILFGGSLLLWQAYRNMTDARRKTSFVANVSHELKTPLTTIRMYAELLGEGRIADETKRRRYLQVIIEESCRLSRLVGNVLDFGRLEQGKKTYRAEPLDLGATLHALLDSQSVRIEKKGMALVRRIPEGRLTVEADRDALEQALLNLIDNTLKYAEQSPALEIEVVREADACRIRVIDGGPGIAAAHRRRIFEKFYRIDDSLTAQQPGSGLGLSIARQLLRDMGGDLVYRAHRGGGACFELSLPCVKEKSHESD